jgi:hypothetical protein
LLINVKSPNWNAMVMPREAKRLLDQFEQFHTLQMLIATDWKKGWSRLRLMAATCGTAKAASAMWRQLAQSQAHPQTPP